MSYEIKEAIQELRSLNKTDTLLVILCFVIIAGTLVIGLNFEPRTASSIALIFMFYIYLGRKELWKKKN